MTIATGQANPNLAFIKYWGNRDNTLHLCMNGSMGLDLNEAEMAELKYLLLE